MGALRAALLALALLPSCASPPPPAPPPPPAHVDERRADPEDELEARVRSVVVAQRAGLRLCYEQGLARDPKLAGRVVLVVEVDQAGAAARVLVGSHEGSFTDEDVKCFARVLRAAHYHDGAGRPVRIQVPLAFAPAG
jgi:hypothetical protein